MDGFSFPTGVTFDPDGAIYVAESGLPFGGAPPGGRLLRVNPGGRRELIANGLRQPVNGVTWHAGWLYVSEGGHPARISRFDDEGRQCVILDGLPGPGNYHTNMVAFGPDGKLYFSQGAMTNTGIVGLDAYELGWLRRLPHAHDIPGVDVVLAGVNVETEDVLNAATRTSTGAFVPFGTTTERGMRIAAGLPCTAAIMRCDPDGRHLELVAWGLRNAYGIGFLPDGRLLATDQGADDRGSRRVAEAPDLLFDVRPGAWYGWPDFVGGDPITASTFRTNGPELSFVLANHDALPVPQRPLLRFPSHSCAVKFDALPLGASVWSGHIFIALFGDERPMTAPPGAQSGRSIARIDPADWSLHDVIDAPLARPIDIRFNGSDGCLYVLDFGRFEMEPGGRITATPASGSLWRLAFETA